jgi:uncharacterized membrane protein (UPF0127 family)
MLAKLFLKNINTKQIRAKEVTIREVIATEVRSMAIKSTAKTILLTMLLIKIFSYSLFAKAPSANLTPSLAPVLSPASSTSQKEEISTEEISPSLSHDDFNKQIYLTRTDSKVKNFKVASFVVAIADNDEKRRLGLMYVKNLPINYGMIFIFDSHSRQNSFDSNIKMWMKNTLIDLDMVFLNKNYRVIGFYKNAKAESVNIINAPDGTAMVLELNSGLIDKLKIKIGDEYTI